MKLNQQIIKLELYNKLSCEEKAILESYGIKPKKEKAVK